MYIYLCIFYNTIVFNGTPTSKFRPLRNDSAVTHSSVIFHTTVLSVLYLEFTLLHLYCTGSQLLYYLVAS